MALHNHTLTQTPSVYVQISVQSLGAGFSSKAKSAPRNLDRKQFGWLLRVVRRISAHTARTRTITIRALCQHQPLSSSSLSSKARNRIILSRDVCARTVLFVHVFSAECSPKKICRHIFSVGLHTILLRPISAPFRVNYYCNCRHMRGEPRSTSGSVARHKRLCSGRNCVESRKPVEPVASDLCSRISPTPQNNAINSTGGLNLDT